MWVDPRSITQTVSFLDLPCFWNEAIICLPEQSAATERSSRMRRLTQQEAIQPWFWMLCYISAITTITHCAMLQALLRQPTACPFDADNFFMKWVAVKKKKKSQNKKNFTRLSHIKTLFGYFFYQHILPRKSLAVWKYCSTNRSLLLCSAVQSRWFLCMEQ